MGRHSPGTALVALSCLLGVSAAPQEGKTKPAASAAIDSGVRGIPNYAAALQSPVADDGEFLRRLMLDLVGYPPTAPQLRAFMADSSEGKRSAKIDELLATDDFADYWTRLFAEVYFGNYHDVAMNVGPALSRPASARIVGDFLKWFKLKLQKDASYAEIVSAMLDARGSDEGDPALAYKLSFYNGEAAPIEFANGAARHLLGIRMVCARCHDHPFDVWSVEDYYGLADFMYLQRVKPEGGDTNSAEKVKVSYVESDEHIVIPDNKIKNDVVKQGKIGPAKTQFLQIVEAPKGADRMKMLAGYMTGKKNPQFAKALVNRVWNWLLGRGLVHPVDDFTSKNKPLSSGVLNGLARDFADNRYSIKHLVKVICASDTYQRSCGGDSAYTRVDYSRAMVRQLNGEQLVNSLRVATGGAPGRDHSVVMQLVGSLYPAGAVWTETTPLPGNARQALLLRNNTEIMGWIGGPVLSAIKAGPGSVEEKVDDLFLSALSRRADDSERQRYVSFLNAHPGQGYEDAYWSLLNSSEFVTRH
ncbi:MAG TPA: DUF1549 domain-containing protein [Planctomycetota bacterium]|nr:DUF1549 domain-containing protein [Planctomycetota bacterium]